MMARPSPNGPKLSKTEQMWNRTTCAYNSKPMPFDAAVRCQARRTGAMSDGGLAPRNSTVHSWAPIAACSP